MLRAGGVYQQRVDAPPMESEYGRLADNSASPTTAVDAIASSGFIGTHNISYMTTSGGS